MTFSDFIQHYGYIAIFFGCFIEGETVLLLGGVAARHGELAFPFVMLSAMLAGCLSDIFFYTIGRFFGNTLLNRFPKYQKKAERAKELIHRYDVGFIVCIRFIYGMRIIGPIILGASQIPAWRFIPFNVLGALIWSCLFAALGFEFGPSLSWLFTHKEGYIYIAIFVVIVVCAIFLWRHFRKLKSTHIDE